MNRCVASVGTFDGVHLGHKAVIRRVLDEAAARSLDSRLITFINHPLSVVAPDRAPLWATSRADTLNSLESSGVTRVSELNFTSGLAALTAVDFMRLVHERYAVDVLVMGPDNSFGSDRLATHEAYIAAGREAGVEILFVDEVLSPAGHRPSSSALRRMVAEGDIAGYDDLSGNLPVVSGSVVRGKRNGSRIGFPTANIKVEGQQPLRQGVYMGWLEFDDEDATTGLYFGLLNVGTNPTVGDDNPVTYEFHIPGGDLGPLYGHKVSVTLMSYLRPDHRFDSLADLKKAIAADVHSLGRTLVALAHDNPDVIDHLSEISGRFLLKSSRRKA